MHITNRALVFSLLLPCLAVASPTQPKDGSKPTSSQHGGGRTPLASTSAQVSGAKEESSSKTPESVSGPPLSGPLTDTIFADPAVIRVGDLYYAYATDSHGLNVPVAKSSNFNNWTVLTNDALPDPGPWAATGKGLSIWAPDVVQIGTGSFVMYYTAEIANHTNDPQSPIPGVHRCIGAATASSPEGPFKPEAEPMICPEGVVIDPCGFADKGDRYVVHKLTMEKPKSTRILLQAVDAKTGTKPQGPPTELTAATQADNGDTEAPSLVHVGDWYYLFFSTGSWNNLDYTVSVAISKTLKGTFKQAPKPLLASGVGRNGKTGTQAGQYQLAAPGGLDVLWAEDNIKDLGGGEYELQAVFHAAESKTELQSRFLWRGLFKVKDGEVSVA